MFHHDFPGEASNGGSAGSPSHITESNGMWVNRITIHHYYDDYIGDNSIRPILVDVATYQYNHHYYLTYGIIASSTD